MKKVSLSLILVSFVCLLSSCAPVNKYQQISKNNKYVLISSNARGQADLIRECMKQALGQGLTIKQAEKQCGEISLALPSGSGISIGDILSGVNGTNPLVGEAACSGNGANPMLSEGSGAGFPEPKSQAEAEKGLEKAKEKFADWVKLNMELTDECNGGKASACLALDYQKTALDLIRAEANYYGNEIAKYTGNNPIKINGTKGQPSSEALNACQHVSEFVGNCNRLDWNSNECKLFSSKLKGCADPRIALTNGDPQNCELQAIDEKQKKKIVLYLCSIKTTPADPDKNPCEKININAEADIYKYGNGGFNSCSNPQALTTGEECFQTLELISVTKDIKDIIKDLGDRFGGPVVILPSAPKPPCLSC